MVPENFLDLALNLPGLESVLRAAIEGPGNPGTKKQGQITDLTTFYFDKSVHIMLVLPQAAQLGIQYFVNENK